MSPSCCIAQTVWTAVWGPDHEAFIAIPFRGGTSARARPHWGSPTRAARRRLDGGSVSLAGQVQEGQLDDRRTNPAAAGGRPDGRVPTTSHAPAPYRNPGAMPDGPRRDIPGGRLGTYKPLVERDTSACATIIPIAAATMLSTTLAIMYVIPAAASPVSMRRNTSTLKVEKVV